MLKIIFNRKGASLPLVMITASVLIIITVALCNSVMQWFKTIRVNEHVEYAYSAADSAIERCFENLDRVITATDFASGLSLTGLADQYETYANQILGRINNNDPLFGARILKTYNIDVLESDTLFANTSLRIERAGVSDLTVAPSGMALTIPIRVTATADFQNGLYNSNNKRVRAVRAFTVFLPSNFKLKGPLYTLGDVIARNGVTATIGGVPASPNTGDVYVFGTTPLRKKETEQWLYGGIYSRDGALLRIEGNAFCRSFIRTGYIDNLSGTTDNGSRISITKDAIAQSIQVFGNSNRIFVGRNAMTIDDLELDGENSILAVNGSYIGLSQEGALYHDSMSGIVNAAPIYNATDAAMSSRIIVNQDVLLGGTTFKMNTDTGHEGEAVFKIEDATLAWHFSDRFGIFDTGSPAYKEFGGNDDNLYRSWMDTNIDNVFGFMNLIQIWGKFTSTDESTIESWCGVAGSSSVNSVRAVRNNNLNSFIVPTTQLSGFFNNMFAANGQRVPGEFQGIYRNIGTNFGYKTLAYLNDNNNFQMDYLEGTPSSAMSGSNYWNVTGTYELFIKSKLRDLREKAFSMINIYAVNNYPLNPEGNPATGGENITNSFVSSNVNPSQTLFDYQNSVLNGISGNHVFNYGSGGSGDINICDDINAAIAADPTNLNSSDYYLVVNNNPARDIVINNSLNLKGMIFTRGRVIFTNGAQMEGAVIAAGRGYQNGIGIIGSAADTYGAGVPCLPVIDKSTTDQTDLDSGRFAAVIFEGTGTGGTAALAYPGRVELLDGLLASGINLYPIF